MRIAIDTGGTFTDCVYLKDGAPQVLKLASTPDDPARSVLEAIRTIAAEENVEVRHGTTIGTNALLEGKGARVAFVTTAGLDRKSTRLNSSHANISYAVFCLKKKKHK